MSKTKIETRKSKTADPYIIDDTAYRYLSALEHAEVLRKPLLAMCRQLGFTPKGAPKTKMLAGELYEVLASRATRTDVDQQKVFDVRKKLAGRTGSDNLFDRFFDASYVHHLRDDWERALAAPAEGFSASRLRDVVTSCLTQRSSRRLTVRKRKLAKLAKSAKSQNREAA